MELVEICLYTGKEKGSGQLRKDLKEVQRVQRWQKYDLTHIPEFLPDLYILRN